MCVHIDALETNGQALIEFLNLQPGFAKAVPGGGHAGDVTGGIIVAHDIDTALGIMTLGGSCLGLVGRRCGALP